MSSRMRTAVAVGCGSIPLFHGCGLVTLIWYFQTQNLIFMIIGVGDILLVPLLSAVIAFHYNLQQSEAERARNIERAWHWNVLTFPHSLYVTILNPSLCSIERRLKVMISQKVTSQKTAYFKHAFFMASRSVPYCHACALGLLVYFHRYPDEYGRYCAYAGVFFLILPLIVGGVTYCFIDHHSWEFNHGEDRLNGALCDLVWFNVVTIIPSVVFMIYCFFVFGVRDVLAFFIDDFPLCKT